MLVLGICVEIFICSTWYLLILRKEINERKIIKRIILLIGSYKKIILLSFLGLIRYDESYEWHVSSSNLKSHIGNMIFTSLFVLGYIVLIPILLPVMFYNIENSAIKYILYLCGLIAVLLIKIKEETQNIIISLNSCIKNVLIPLEKSPNLINDHIREIKKDKKYIVIFICFLIAASIMFVIISKIDVLLRKNTVFTYLIFVIICLFLIIDYVKCRTKKAEKIKDRKIEFDISYSQIEMKILQMCHKLNIECAKFEVCKDKTIVNAEASYDSNGCPVIKVTFGFLHALGELSKAGDSIDEMFQVVVAHELAHIYYGDFKDVCRRIRITCLIVSLVYVLIFTLSYLFISNVLFLIIVMLLMIINLILGNVMCDKRYWKQIAELKADRLGVSLCDGNKEAFKNFWDKTNLIKKEENTIDNLNKSNKIYQYYKRYVENEDHPCIERRLYLINTRKQWEWWEYFEHAIIIRLWRITKKGWNGR